MPNSDRVLNACLLDVSSMYLDVAVCLLLFSELQRSDLWPLLLAAFFTRIRAPRSVHGDYNWAMIDQRRLRLCCAVVRSLWRLSRIVEADLFSLIWLALWLQVLSSGY